MRECWKKSREGGRRLTDKKRRKWREKGGGRQQWRERGGRDETGELEEGRRKPGETEGTRSRIF